MLPAFRSEIYKASAYISDEASRSAAATRTARLRFDCETGGVPSIRNVLLGTPLSQTTMATILGELEGLGYGSPYSLENPLRYLVYFDGIVGPAPYGWNGQAGGGGGRDRRPSRDDETNRGGFYAIDYASDTGLPDWWVIVHEIFHNMGAVADDAPQSSGAGHCTVDADIMCYTDDAGIPTTRVCQYTELDCGADTYFNAGAPAPGSFLDLHWNVAAPYNRFLFHGPLEQDNTRPSRAGSPSQSAATSRSATASWAASTDDYGPPKYRVWWLDDRHSFPGDLRLVATTAATGFTFTGLDPLETRKVRIEAIDDAGNTAGPGPSALLVAGPDVSPPTSPDPVSATAVLDAAGFARVQLSFPPSVDDVGVSTYLVQHEVNGAWTDLTSLPSSESSISAAFDTVYSLRIVARDAAGNRSLPSAAVTVRTGVSPFLDPCPDGAMVAGECVRANGGGFPAGVDPPAPTLPVVPPTRDRTGPTVPKRFVVSQLGPHSVTLAWRPSSDDRSGIREYRVTRRIGAVWRLHKRVSMRPQACCRYRFRLTPSTTYMFGVEAVDGAGNVSKRVTLRFRTPRPAKR